MNKFAQLFEAISLMTYPKKFFIKCTAFYLQFIQANFHKEIKMIQLQFLGIIKVVSTTLNFVLS